MSRGEERSTIFLLTTVTVGCLTEAITRFVSLMRFTLSIKICFSVGVLGLVLLFLEMGLTED
jgi:hypothetical protein